MKKKLSVKLCALLLALISLIPAGLSAAAVKDPIYDISLDSQGVCVMNTETGAVLYEKNADLRMYPASTTKVLTALLVLEECQDTLNTTITVQDTSLFSSIIEEGGVNTDMRRGEVFTVQDLLLGMMMNSFCDAAQLLAWHFGGESVENFIAKMNEKGEELGLINSHFANAHGLHDPEHYSCPRDIAILMEEAVKDPRFVELIQTRSGQIAATEQRGARQLRYTVSIFYPENEYYLDSFVGGKSGFTDQAGRCLVAFSQKDGLSFVSVMLGANMDSSKHYGSQNMAWIETSTLLSYIYENFSLQPLLEQGQQMASLPVVDSETEVPVVVGEDLILLARNGMEAEYRLDLPEEISAPDVENGAVVGRVTMLFNDGEGERSCPLILQWDGTPIVTKSVLEKEGQKAVEAVRRIFREDRSFVILVALLLAVVAISIPALKVTQHLHRKKSRPPKH